MTSDRAALWAAIAAQPGEDTPKLALADWYDEHDEPRTAYALRWCVARKKWPRQFANGQAGWYESGRATEHSLPGLLWGQVSLRARHWSARFGSVERAVHTLGTALADLKAVYALQTNGAGV